MSTPDIPRYPTGSEAIERLLFSLTDIDFIAFRHGTVAGVGAAKAAGPHDTLADIAKVAWETPPTNPVSESIQATNPDEFILGAAIAAYHVRKARG